MTAFFSGRSKIVTVFGGSGFIGRYVVRLLAQQGWVVRVAVRRPSQAAFLKTSGDVGQIAPIYASLIDRASIEAAIDGADAVVNLCGILYERGPQTFEAVHNLGPAMIAEAARDAEVAQMVHISALGASFQSASLYARTKAAGEQAVLDRFPTATILRPSLVIGWEDDFFNRFAGMARISPFLPLIGGGQTRMQPVYVRDVAEAVMASLTNTQAQGNTYELGGPSVYTFRALLEMLMAEIERPRKLISIPFGLAHMMGSMAQYLPIPPLTADQVKLLKSDTVVHDEALTLADLGITPNAIEVVMPTYLERYRPGGRFVARSDRAS